MMSFTEAVKTCLVKKYATKSGRATRAEYWWFQLFIWSITIVLSSLGFILHEDFLVGMVFWYIITFIPNICSEIRRLHDTGYSGTLILWQLLPIVGTFFRIYIYSNM